MNRAMPLPRQHPIPSTRPIGQGSLSGMSKQSPYPANANTLSPTAKTSRVSCATDGPQKSFGSVAILDRPVPFDFKTAYGGADTSAMKPIKDVFDEFTKEGTPIASYNSSPSKTVLNAANKPSIDRKNGQQKPSKDFVVHETTMAQPCNKGERDIQPIGRALKSEPPSTTKTCGAPEATASIRNIGGMTQSKSSSCPTQANTKGMTQPKASSRPTQANFKHAATSTLTAELKQSERGIHPVGFTIESSSSPITSESGAKPEARTEIQYTAPQPKSAPKTVNSVSTMRLTAPAFAGTTTIKSGKNGNHSSDIIKDRSATTSAIHKKSDITVPSPDLHVTQTKNPTDPVVPKSVKTPQTIVLTDVRKPDPVGSYKTSSSAATNVNERVSAEDFGMGLEPPRISKNIPRAQESKASQTNRSDDNRTYAPTVAPPPAPGKSIANEGRQPTKASSTRFSPRSNTTETSEIYTPRDTSSATKPSSANMTTSCNSKISSRSNMKETSEIYTPSDASSVMKPSSASLPTHCNWRTTPETVSKLLDQSSAMKRTQSRSDPASQSVPAPPNSPPLYKNGESSPSPKSITANPPCDPTSPILSHKNENIGNKKILGKSSSFDSKLSPSQTAPPSPAQIPDVSGPSTLTDIELALFYV